MQPRTTSKLRKLPIHSNESRPLSVDVFDDLLMPLFDIEVAEPNYEVFATFSTVR
jgi:hypothetical protein